MTKEEFLVKLAALANEYETSNNNPVIGLKLSLPTGGLNIWNVFAWDGERMSRCEDEVLA